VSGRLSRPHDCRTAKWGSAAVPETDSPMIQKLTCCSAHEFDRIRIAAAGVPAVTGQIANHECEASVRHPT
jgi:hypothetical protein